MKWWFYVSVVLGAVALGLLLGRWIAWWASIL